MRPLARYARANTVARAKVSTMLSRTDLDTLEHAASFEEFWGLLRNTAYGAALPLWADQSAYEIDRQLHRVSGERFRSVARALSGKPGAVATLLLSRWDLDALKFALRLWHGGESLSGDTSYACFVDAMPIDHLMTAENLGGVARALEGTPYARALLPTLRPYAAHRSLYYVEAALENDFYRRLGASVEALGGQEALEGKAMIEVETGLLNLSLLGRLLHYHDLSPEEAAAFTVGRGKTASDDPLGVIQARLGQTALGVSEGAGPVDSLALLEHVLRESMSAAAYRALAGYPFSITTVLAVYFLIRLELKSLRSIVAAKSVNLGKGVFAVLPRAPR